MRSFALAIAALLLLSSCADDPEPIQPSPKPDAPAMPPQAKKKSPEGVASFVKHYVEVLNYASKTGRVQELARLSADSCKGCESYIDLFRSTYESGGYFRGGEWEISDYELEVADRSTIVFVHVDAPAGTTRANGSASQTKTSPEDSEILFEVQTVTDQYRVMRFERAAQ
jgi:hypothetical protein